VKDGVFVLVIYQRVEEWPSATILAFDGYTVHFLIASKLVVLCKPSITIKYQGFYKKKNKKKGIYMTN
jgi:hypothetical protein